MIRNREEFKNYCLRALGAPVIKIDCTEDQVEDRIDEAVDFWQQYNNEGAMKCFLKQLVTASRLTLAKPFGPKNIWVDGSEIHGKTSGAMAMTCSYPDGTASQGVTVLCRDIHGVFLPGETVEINGKEYQLSKGDNYVVKGIIDEKRIKVPDHILGVTRIIPFNNSSSSQNLLDFETQFKIASLVDLLNTDIINYTMVMTHYDLLQHQINAKPDFEFNRHEGYVYPVLHWEMNISPGSYVVMEAYRMIDPNQSYKAWNDRWLKRYTIALIQRQWGINLRKYNGIQLAGGATLDGQTMLQEAKDEIQRLEEEMWNNLPPSAFMIG